jgi:signal transduction histidine kinase
MNAHETAAVNKSHLSSASLPVVLLLCFAISVGLGLYVLHFLRDLLVQERGADLARTAARAADTLDRVLFERYGDIQLFANDSALMEGDPHTKVERLQRYKKLYWYYSWIAVTDAEGRMIAATDPVPQRQGGPPGWFEAVLKTGHIHLESAQRSAEAGGVMAVGFTAPIYGPQGDFRGAVTSRIPLENLRAILEQEGKLEYGDLAQDWLVLDRNGLIIVEKNQPSGPDSSSSKIELPRNGWTAPGRDKAGFVEELHDRLGIPFVTGYAATRGYREFPGFDWTVLVRLDRERAYAPIYRLIWSVGLIGFLIVAPLTGFGMWTSWKLARERNDLIQARQALEKSVVELARSNSDLQQFAYVASHDLQEPLRMVASYTQLLAKRYKGKLDADADEFIAYAVGGASRMQKLIQDLLSYSRVDTQGQAGEPTPVGSVLDYALGNLRAALEESRAEVTRDPLPTVMADERQLLQVFQNLLSNALKFRGEQPPRVHVSAERRGNEWVFSVRDNGIGIDPQYAGRIFVVFQRLHNISEYPGTGIGLAICKKIVERHGGRIWMESQPGQGATFYFTLPA